MSILVGGMCGVCCQNYALVLAFTHLYGIFNLRLFLSILFFIYLFLSGIETPNRNGQWYQHNLTLFAFFFFTRTIPKGQHFGLCLDVLRM